MAAATRSRAAKKTTSKKAPARKTAAKKAPAKKAPAKKTTAKKAVAKKAPAKKTTAKKTTAKKTTAKKTTAKKTTAKKTAAKKTPAKKTVAKKAPAKKTTAKKAVAKKTVAKKAPAKKTTAKKAVAKKAPAKKSAAKKATAKKSAAKKAPAFDMAELFLPLTEGERADALRLLLEDRRLAAMAKVGRYRVIALEPLVLKSDDPHRIARIVIYDYAADRCVEANVDLDEFEVQHLDINRSQPMLAVEEELAAMDIAIADTRVAHHLNLGDTPQAAMHYWSQKSTELSHNRRSAAVLFGQPGARASLVVVVDLLDGMVSEIVPAEQW